VRDITDHQHTVILPQMQHIITLHITNNKVSCVRLAHFVHSQ